MTYFFDYDEQTYLDETDTSRRIYIGDNVTPKGMELPEQYIIDMIDRGGKIQYWLMDNGFDKLGDVNRK